MRRRLGIKTGRPIGSKATHTIATEAARKHLIERVVKELDEILDPILKQAKAGELDAATFLLNQALGKAKESLEIEHDADDPYSNLSPEEIAEGIARILESRRKNKGP